MEDIVQVYLSSGKTLHNYPPAPLVIPPLMSGRSPRWGGGGGAVTK